MNALHFIRFTLKSRKSSLFFTLSAMTIAVTLVFTVLTISRSLEESVKRNSGDYELLAGAEGSGMQLVMSTTLRLDAPLGNIPYSLVDQLRADKRVLKAVPVALGDSYNGIPIVGTDASYFSPHRPGLPDRFKLRAGGWFDRPGEAVIGSEAAKQAGLAVGSHFYGLHGLGSDSGDVHRQLEYRVVGVLEPTGTADDYSLYTSMDTIWRMHDGGTDEHAGGQAADAHDGRERQVTAILIKPQMLGYAPGLKDELDRQANVQAVYPVQQFRKLYDAFRMGQQAALLLSAVCILLAVLSVFIALTGAMAERRREMAILRALGMPRQRLLRNVLLEALTVSLAATALGLLLSRLLSGVAAYYGQKAWGLVIAPLPLDASTVAVGFAFQLAAVLICLTPAFRLYRRHVQHFIQEGAI